MEERTFVLISDLTKDIKKVNKLLKNGFRIYARYEVNGVTGFELYRYNVTNTFVPGNAIGQGLVGGNITIRSNGDY